MSKNPLGIFCIPEADVLLMHKAFEAEGHRESNWLPTYGAGKMRGPICDERI